MKKLIPIFAGLFMLATSCVTDSGIPEAFLKYSHRQGVTSITVPGWVISLAARFGDLSAEERDLLESIDKAKVLSVEDRELNAQVNFYDEFRNKINRSGKYEELLTVNDDNESVTVFGVLEDDVIREMVVLVGGDENALVYVRGEISPQLISKAIGQHHSGQLLSFDF